MLFDEVAAILTRAVHTWAGVALPEAEADRTARDLLAMVDGFAAPGFRHLRARRARRRQEQRLVQLIESERRSTADGEDGPVPGDPRQTPFRAVALHRSAEGEFLDPRTAAVEVLNILRPTVAVTWFATFAAHALHRWPEHRSALSGEDSAYAYAFAQEVRRFYPFAPFIGGLAAEKLEWLGRPIRPGTLVLLDLYGQNHDPDLWPRPYDFTPSRFVDASVRAEDLVPQGGGDPATGHRCPGEDITLSLLAAVSTLLSGLEYRVAEQDLTIPLKRVPTGPRNGFVIEDVR